MNSLTAKSSLILRLQESIQPSTGGPSALKPPQSPTRLRLAGRLDRTGPNTPTDSLHKHLIEAAPSTPSAETVLYFLLALSSIAALGFAILETAQFIIHIPAR